jgi:hypothetical protein
MFGGNMPGACVAASQCGASSAFRAAAEIGGGGKEIGPASSAQLAADERQEAARRRDRTWMRLENVIMRSPRVIERSGAQGAAGIPFHTWINLTQLRS